MNQHSMETQVRRIIVALKAGKHESEVCQIAEDCGVDAKKIPDVVDSIQKGFRAGTNSVVTYGLSEKDIKFGDDHYFDEAFKHGKAAMRFTGPYWVLVKYFLAMAIVAFLVWLLLR